MLNYEIKALNPADYEKCYEIWGSPQAEAEQWLDELDQR